MRVAVSTGCDERECRFHFFADGDIAGGGWGVFTITGTLRISSVWAEFGL